MCLSTNKPSHLLNTGSTNGVEYEAIRRYRRDNPQASVKAVASWARSELKLDVDVSKVYQILIGGNDDPCTRHKAKVDFSKTWPMSQNKVATTPISRPCLSNTLSRITMESSNLDESFANDDIDNSLNCNVHLSFPWLTNSGDSKVYGDEADGCFMSDGHNLSTIYEEDPTQLEASTDDVVFCEALADYSLAHSSFSTSSLNLSSSDRELDIPTKTQGLQLTSLSLVHRGLMTWLEHLENSDMDSFLYTEAAIEQLHVIDNLKNINKYFE